jgi:hypothetical protein
MSNYKNTPQPYCDGLQSLPKTQQLGPNGVDRGEAHSNPSPLTRDTTYDR